MIRKLLIIRRLDHGLCSLTPLLNFHRMMGLIVAFLRQDQWDITRFFQADAGRLGRNGFWNGLGEITVWLANEMCSILLLILAEVLRKYEAQSAIGLDKCYNSCTLEINSGQFQKVLTQSHLNCHGVCPPLSYTCLRCKQIDFVPGYKMIQRKMLGTCLALQPKT